MCFCCWDDIESIRNRTGAPDSCCSDGIDFIRFGHRLKSKRQVQGTRILNFVMASRNLLRSYSFHCWSDVIMSISDVIFFAIVLGWMVWDSRFVIERQRVKD